MIDLGDDKIILGVNDSFSILHRANDIKNQGHKTLISILEETNEKRYWGAINPGIRMAQAYMYFVYGHERKILNIIDDNTKKDIINKIQFKSQFKALKKDEGEFEGVLRHLRNSISHARYTFKPLAEQISNTREILVLFEDFVPNGNEKKFHCEFSITLFDFENLIENLGKESYNNAL